MQGRMGPPDAIELRDQGCKAVRAVQVPRLDLVLLGVHVFLAAREPGSEEYVNSEKYEIKAWDLDRPDSLAPLVAQLNRIRRAHPALHSNARLAFHPVDDERLL